MYGSLTFARIGLERWKELCSRCDVMLVTAAERPDQILFFMVDADQYVGRHSAGEQQVADGHYRGEPDADKCACHNRVAYMFVK